MLSGTGWVLPAFAASFAIAMHYLLLRAASGRLGDALGALVLEGTAALGIAAYYALTGRSTEVPTTRAGIGFAVLSGLAISVGSILLFMALRRGGPVASTGTIVMGGGVAISALASPWLFGEGFTLRRAVGVALGIAAMYVLSRDADSALP